MAFGVRKPSLEMRKFREMIIYLKIFDGAGKTDRSITCFILRVPLFMNLDNISRLRVLRKLFFIDSLHSLCKTLAETVEDFLLMLGVMLFLVTVTVVTSVHNITYFNCFK